MHKSQNLAGLLFVVVRVMAIIAIFISLFSFLILCLSLYTGMSNLPIQVNGNYFIIYYPFTKIPFLAGDHTADYMVSSSGITFLYGCFLWLLGSVFNAYRKPKLFVSKNVKRLNAFYLFNFITPMGVLIYLLLTGTPVHDVLVIIFLHLMLAVFVYFMAEIFKHGLLLQEEQDLTL